MLSSLFSPWSLRRTRKKGHLTTLTENTSISRLLFVIIVAASALLFIPPVSSADSISRIWTSSDGKALEARYIGMEQGRVMLEGSDGRKLAIRPDHLSEADQQYLKEQSTLVGEPRMQSDMQDVPAASDQTFAPDADAVVAAMGLPLWSEGLLWGRQAETVAAELQWPEESRTSNSSSYRYYPRDPVIVFDRNAYTMAMYAEEGKPVSLSFVFANKGDVPRMLGLDLNMTQSEFRRATKDYKKLIREDAVALEKNITALFGSPGRVRLGDSRETEEKVLRWDWKDSSFLLSSPGDEYVSLRILPSESLDGSGMERVQKKDLQSILAGRVERRDNGDVILTDIPMVNQGPKGYCVPATWERVLRYMGIPSDMYILAMAGDTGVGGGTVPRELSHGARQLVRHYGRTIRTQRARIIDREIAMFIDKGIPILWSMCVVDELNEALTRRMNARRMVSDWEEWAKLLKPARKDARKIKTDSAGNHTCLIIGYNSATEEIAISDSWGPAYAERWITIEEAEAISRGEFTYIAP